MHKQGRDIRADRKQVWEPGGRKGLGLCEEQREAGAAEAEPARERQWGQRDQGQVRNGAFTSERTEGSSGTGTGVGDQGNSMSKDLVAGGQCGKILVVHYGPLGKLLPGP